MIRLAPERDALLTDFGKTTLRDRYLLPGENYQDLFSRVAQAYADDADHAQRLYDYMSKLWFMPATPILSNGGAGRGLPISCFLNTVDDSLEGIQATWNENNALASHGGGIGTYWGGVRSIGEKIAAAGETSGIIPFIKVMDSLTLAISQGSLRRGSAAVYTDISHPEIEEFLELRKPTGDQNRRSLNLHHGICITDAFMEAVRNGQPFDLVSPKTGEVRKTIDARTLWQKVLEVRLQTGEPYLLFTNTCNRALPEYQKARGLKVRQSNLCSEITLATNEFRTAVCCLSSVNAATYLEWRTDPNFIPDIFSFLDNVLEDFIRRAPVAHAKAVYSAMQERAVGLGVMGFHTFLQQQNLPFGSAMAKSWNRQIFKYLRAQANFASAALAAQRGPCPDAASAGVSERFSHKLAIAPTASISIICGTVSASIEPIPANVYSAKTLSGTFEVRNPQLEALLLQKAMLLCGPPGSHQARLDEWWDSILEHDGSVQHLDCLTDEEKEVFLTAWEIDQRWIVELAIDRAPEICQAQSINLFLPADVDKWDLHMLHWRGWEGGLKSFYYVRSKSLQRAAHAGGVVVAEPTNYEECIACQ